MAANTLTGLIPTLYDALNIVSRELVGFIPAVAKNTSGESAALDQTISVPVVPSASATDITPSNATPNSGNQTIGKVDMSIAESRMVPVQWQGEEQKGYKGGGTYEKTLRDQFAEAFRTLTNEVEVDIWEAAYKASSRAYGTAGTTPFASSLADAAQIKKILDDNGAPPGDRSLVLNTTAGVNLRSLANLMTADANGSDQTLRNGILLPIVGLDIRESGGISTHTKGTATGMDCTAIEPVGEVTIAMDGSNSGTVLAGDVVVNTTEGDGILYVVNSGSTLTGNASGNMILNAPGVRVATAINDEFTTQATHTPNVAFHKNAVQLITRAPQMPDGGDIADDVMNIQDPVSGIVFQIALYRQYRQVHFEVGLAWGVTAIKSAHIATLLG